MEGEILYLLIGIAALVVMCLLRTTKKIVRILLGLAAAAAICCYIYAQFIA